ncbi:hypothetical protein C361_06064 [Cryptococcus neoformans Tu259-1]|uniref:Uncharacterized protein n=1 Tax=Cryptococcus neoformans Tu259-1 TaxID=1230072 RepID=A0A854QC76_CRYNE|nr:hypothetical protein C361_06064 [Cryptococcus neoformans var. grubii Tu259-1]
MSVSGFWWNGVLRSLFLPHSRNTAQFKRRGKNIVQHMALPLSQYPSSYTA